MIFYALKFEKHWMRRVDEIMEGESIHPKGKKVCTLDNSFKELKSRKKQTKGHASPNKNTIERLSKEHEKNYGAFQYKNHGKIK